MRLKVYLFCSFCLFCLPWCIPGSLLNATTWHIKQDGTGNFTTIQEGIDASADSDTILVYPGTYLENINFSGKNITVASLYLTTGDEQYINQTIIDGNQNGSCVRIMSGEDSTAVLYGFTITNGSGSTYFEDGPICGGGILLMETQAQISNCVVKNNNAYGGGGVFCRLSQISLSNVDIINNHAGVGGAIYSREDSEINFSQNEFCNIYLNYAALGCEIAKSFSSPPMEVYVDTFTVEDPDEYFIYSRSTIGVPLNDVTLYAQNAKLEPVNADLYVYTNGDNNNNGLSADEPLSTINYALSLVKSDSLHHNTIHIADGTYSKSSNNNCFPLCMRGCVSLVGESMENTILDAENNSPHISDGYSKLDYSIKNISFINGYNGDFGYACILITAHQQQGKFVNLENIKISDFQLSTARLLELHQVNIYMKNIISTNNHNPTLRPFNSHQPEIEVIIENSYIHENNQDNSSDDSFYQIQLGLGCSGLISADIINTEITDNYCYSSPYPVRCSGIEAWYDVNLNLINCTLGNNTSPNTGGVIVLGNDSRNSVVNIYNSILYGDSPDEIYINNQYSSNPCTVNIKNSLIDGGFEGIENPYSFNIVNWLEGNLNEDPCWDVTGEYPYALSANSPCIDAGTLDLPPGIELPEYDLAGNPRIYGETIDMGAYEYQGVDVEDENLQSSIFNTQLSNHPNPFNPSTTIKLDLAESGKIELVIYNVKGQKIKTLMDAYSCKGHFEIIWRGIDKNGKKVASGNYFIKLKVDGETRTVKKCTLLK